MYKHCCRNRNMTLSEKTSAWESGDTVIYGFNKMVRLLLECNPNACEMLGMEEGQYLIVSPLGRELLAHQNIFLSKKAIRSFGGYAQAQLRRLQNAIARDTLSQSDRENHILKSVTSALDDFNRRHPGAPGSIRLYIDKSEHPKLDTEIFVDAQYEHYPLREYVKQCETMHTVVRDYDKIGKRNHKKDRSHLNKHAMHLVRLLMTAVCLLEEGVIRTRQTEGIPLLLAIRKGEFMQADGTFSQDFYEMLAQYEQRLEKAAANTVLPDQPDLQQVEKLVERINRYTVTGAKADFLV